VILNTELAEIKMIWSFVHLCTTLDVKSRSIYAVVLIFVNDITDIIVTEIIWPPRLPAGPQGKCVSGKNDCIFRL
jgi:hypothetical protein